jgi:type VI protein secretion system component VasK
VLTRLISVLLWCVDDISWCVDQLEVMCWGVARLVCLCVCVVCWLTLDRQRLNAMNRNMCWRVLIVLVVLMCRLMMMCWRLWCRRNFGWWGRGQLEENPKTHRNH